MSAIGFAASSRARLSWLVHRQVRLGHDNRGFGPSWFVDFVETEQVACAPSCRPQWSRLPFCYGRTKTATDPSARRIRPSADYQRACMRLQAPSAIVAPLSSRRASTVSPAQRRDSSLASASEVAAARPTASRAAGEARRWRTDCRCWLATDEADGSIVRELDLTPCAAGSGSGSERAAHGRGGAGWRVRVKTRSVRGAATDANVSLQLRGERAASAVMPLSKSEHWNKSAAAMRRLPRRLSRRPAGMCGLLHGDWAVAPTWVRGTERPRQQTKQQASAARLSPRAVPLLRVASVPDATQRATHARLCGLAWRLGHTGSRRRRRTRSTWSCNRRSASSAPCVWGTTTRASRPAGAAADRARGVQHTYSMAHGMQGTAWNSRGSHAHWRRLCPCCHKHSNTHVGIRGMASTRRLAR